MDRRTFIATGTWFSACAYLPPWFADAANVTAAAGPRDALAVFDSSLAQAGACARYAARLRISAFEIGDDIGALWYSALAPCIAHSRTGKPAHHAVALIGIARASDFFVLARLALQPGRIASGATEASQPHAAAPVSFVIS
ncbi:MAG TPA: hypothetical protein VGL08_01330, partial [Paraburkholderia sp.]